MNGFISASAIFFICLVPQQVTGINSTDVNEGIFLNLTITWTRPSSDLPITHYEVEYKEDNVVQPIVTADDEFVVRWEDIQCKSESRQCCWDWTLE